MPHRIIFSLLVGILAAAQLHSAVFIKSDGVDGESTDADHRGWSEVDCWSWDSSLDTGEVGSGRTPGTLAIGPLRLTTAIDRATPALLQLLHSGAAVSGDVVLEQVDDASRQLWLRIILQGVRLESMALESKAATATTDITVRFDRIRMDYYWYSTTNESAGAESFTWDLAATESF
ncbi:MAG: type VI secretion system tube protein Hcp [Planctomycetota bacterium]